MGFYKGKDVLVTGGTGLIGIPLVRMLVGQNANVTVASLDDPDRVPKGATFKRSDLRHFSNCIDVCKNIEIVFHLAGVKGSPAAVKRRPASFLVPTISFNTNMMEAARRCGVERYLYTSSIGVYSPADVLKEEDISGTTPSTNDRFAGWAKRMGELQAEAYAIEYGWEKISIVRPANVYGPYDNFETENAMVIPSLIKRAIDGEKPLTVWGDGSATRDFIHSEDVALGMLLAVEKEITTPINLGSGIGVTIKEIAETIVANLPGDPIKIKWDITRPKGDNRRVLDVSRAFSYGFRPRKTIEQGIKETISWYLSHGHRAGSRYEVFTDGHLSKEYVVK